MYAPQEFPAVFSSVLSSSVIVITVVPGPLPPRIVPALGLRLHIPKSLPDAPLFMRYILQKKKYPLHKSPDLCERCISLSGSQVFHPYSAVRHEIPSFQPVRAKTRENNPFIAADLREMQGYHGFSEVWIDKFEFVIPILSSQKYLVLLCRKTK